MSSSSLATLALASLTIIISLPRPGQSTASESRLYAKLLTGYNRLERPCANFSDALVVTLGIALQQIADVGWKDYKLSWNPADFEGISDVRFRRQDLWTPDVLLYNSADKDFDSTYASNLVVYSDGSVNWIPPGIFRSTCKMHIQYFPFDEQRCSLRFGSWTYNGLRVDLQPPDPDAGMDTSDYLINASWVNRSVRHYYNEFSGQHEPYISLLFTMVILRRQTYFLLNVIFPAVLISAMSALSFYLPPDSGEKMSIGMTVLLSVTLFISMLSSMTPTTSEATPLIGRFFAACLWLSAISVVVGILVLNYKNGASGKRLQGWSRQLLLDWLPRALRLKPLKCVEQQRRRARQASDRARHRSGGGGGGERAHLLLMTDSNDSQPQASASLKTYDQLHSLQKMIAESQQTVWLSTVSRRQIEYNRKHHEADGNRPPQYPVSSPSPSPVHKQQQQQQAALHRTGALSRSATHLQFSQPGKPTYQARLPMVTSGPVSHDMVVDVLRVLFEQIGAELSEVVCRMRRQDECDEIGNEWLYAAFVVDRFFLWLFTAGFCAICLIFAACVPEWNP